MSLMAENEHKQARYLLSQFVLPNDIGLHPFIHHRRSISNNGMNAHHIIHVFSEKTKNCEKKLNRLKF